VLNLTVTGGTGRFEGAAGEWVEVTRFADAFTPGGGTDPYVAAIEGTISNPGANKQ
jgi:hypothetical protein